MIEGVSFVHRCPSSHSCASLSLIRLLNISADSTKADTIKLSAKNVMSAVIALSLERSERVAPAAASGENG